MLFALKLQAFILFLGVMLTPPVKGHSCSQDQELSLVNELNHHAERLSKTSQNGALLKEPHLGRTPSEEAQAIVQNALEVASDVKNCSQAQALVNHSEEGLRQTLKATFLKRVFNGNSKGLSDSRVTETGVNETRIDDTSPYPKLLVFVSFAIPAETLKILNSQVKQLGGKLVLRGLIKGSFQETAQKLKELQLDIMIDPPLFEAYSVARCPTFILRSSPTESAEEEIVSDLMTGNVSLDYVLEQFSSSGDTRHEALHMLKILRREP